jgi:hypothetical protein
MENAQEQYRLAQSPFAIPLEDVDALAMEEGFQLLRKYLAHNAKYVSPLSIIARDAS